ncbi:MAG: phosphatase PAP2 family protein [Clostridia bacterium]|nr:phosphatase PAP2 family protein [Clostridia bacterium]
MELLKMLQTIRNPVLDVILGAITYLGDETILMVLGMAVLWCMDKKWGYRLMFISLAGTALNQLLKAIFLIPRPWVLDPAFEIVESARAAATGYSFPSGHTQTVATVFGTIACWTKKRWAQVICVVIVLLVGFSRMYLGVHTPLDVGVSLLTGFVMVVLLNRLMSRHDSSDKGRAGLCIGFVLSALALLAYVLFAPKREANVAEFDAQGLKAAWTLMGAMAGMVLTWYVDAKHTHFETKAVWWAQLIKLTGGLALVMAVRTGVKPLFTALWGDAMFAHGIRYFLMVLAGGVLWPMTFRWFSRLDGKTLPATEKA